MNSEQISAFLCVYENKSFSKAAKILGKNQSAVSQLIQSLERELNAQLFLRNKRPITATKNGELFLQHARIIDAEINQSIAELASRNTGSFTFAYHISMNSPIDQYIEQCYQNRLPNIMELSIPAYNNPELWDENTLYLVRSLSITGKSVHRRKAFETPVYAAVSVQSPLARRNSLNLEDLRGQTFILPPASERTEFTKAIVRMLEKDAPIKIRESSAGFGADLAYVYLNHEVLLTTPDLFRYSPKITYLPIENGIHTAYDFASLNPFTPEMKQFMQGFYEWDKKRKGK